MWCVRPRYLNTLPALYWRSLVFLIHFRTCFLVELCRNQEQKMVETQTNFSLDSVLNSTKTQRDNSSTVKDTKELQKDAKYWIRATELWMVWDKSKTITLEVGHMYSVWPTKQKCEFFVIFTKLKYFGWNCRSDKSLFGGKREWSNWKEFEDQIGKCPHCQCLSARNPTTSAY